MLSAVDVSITRGVGVEIGPTGDLVGIGAKLGDGSVPGWQLISHILNHIIMITAGFFCNPSSSEP